MNHIGNMLPEALALAAALSLDAFVASFAYGSKQINIPLRSVQIINGICTGITAIALLAGGLIKQWLPPEWALIISFAVLFLLGIVKLLDSATKSIIRKHNQLHKQIDFSMFNFKFILHLYANPESADVDGSKTLSPIESISLAIALSLDGITVGLGAAIGDVNGVAVILASLVTNMLAVMLGCWVGNKVAKNVNFDLSWLSGVILIILAFAKLG